MISVKLVWLVWFGYEYLTQYDVFWSQVSNQNHKWYSLWHAWFVTRSSTILLLEISRYVPLLITRFLHFNCSGQCFGTVGWAVGRASGPQKIWGNGGGGHWLVRMEWRPAGWSACLPLLISPCTIKSRSSLLEPAHPGGPRKGAAKRLWCGGVYCSLLASHLCVIV